MFPERRRALPAEYGILGILVLAFRALDRHVRPFYGWQKNIKEEII
jgi:hypothetical protein